MLAYVALLQPVGAILGVSCSPSSWYHLLPQLHEALLHAISSEGGLEASVHGQLCAEYYLQHVEMQLKRTKLAGSIQHSPQFGINCSVCCDILLTSSETPCFDIAFCMGPCHLSTTLKRF